MEILDYFFSKNWCFWTVVLEKTLENLLYCKEIQPVHPKGNQSWIFIGKIDAKAETPILWPSDAKNWLNGKHPDAGKDWRWEEKRMREDEMVGWHHWLNGHEFEYTLGVGYRHRAWHTAVHGITESQTGMSDWTELNFFGVSPNILLLPSLVIIDDWVTHLTIYTKLCYPSFYWQYEHYQYLETCELRNFHQLAE